MTSGTPNENLFFYITNHDLDDDKHSYKNRMKEVNLLLTMNGFTEIGDLFDPSLYSVNKTLNVVNSLIQDRQQLLEAKSQLMHKVAKSEAEYFTIVEKSEVNKEKVSEMNKKNDFFKNKLNVDEKKFKEDLDKMKIEKADLEKLVNRLTMKESQFKHELKKNEKDIEELKAKLKKLITDKDKDRGIGGNNLINNANINFTSSSNFYNTANLQKSGSNNNIFDNNKISSAGFTNAIEKNSPNVLTNINHFKEFYNLIYQALNEKVTQILSENEELKNYYKIILREINQYIDFKKLILYKLNQDSIEEMKTALKDNTILNFNIFELDFSESKDVILTNFNEILNAFRFILIYDMLKVEPSSEFEFEELKKLVVNKKYDFDSLPYYKQLKDTLESFDFAKLSTLKETIMKSNFGASLASTSKRKSVPKDEIFVPDSNTERMLINNILNSENKGKEHLEEMNKDLTNAMNNFEDMFDNLEKEINNCMQKK